MNHMPLSKIDKFLFTTAILLYTLFYGIMNFLFSHNIPSSFVSAPMSISIFLIGFYLFVKDILVYKGLKYTLNFYIIVGSLFWIFLAILAFNQQYMFSNDIKSSPLFRIYIFMVYGVAYFLLFVMSPSRMEYFKNCDAYFLAGSLFSSLIIIFSGNIDLSTGEAIVEGVSRATIKEPFMMLFVMSAYWMFFCSFKKKLVGAGCSLLSFYGIYLSTSQSALVSMLLVLAGVFVLSLLSHSIKNIMFIFAALPVVLIAGISYMYSSKGFERISHLVDWQVYYNAGGGGYDTSRIDLLKWGWETFQSSPIFGFNPYLPTGAYTHFFIMDILMCMGLFGIVFLFAFFASIIKGISAANRLYGRSSYWMILLFVYSLTQSMFHGSVSSVMGIGFSLMIGLSLYRSYK